MKRYRVVVQDFDTRASVLALEIADAWKTDVKAQWLAIKDDIRQELIVHYGALDSDRKTADFTALGPIPVSVVAFHNLFLHQARDAFVVGAYYPCLVACCALGERVLNHLVLRLRDAYKESDWYKRVHRKKTFNNWDAPISALESWSVLLPGAASTFRKLRDLRNSAIHFDPSTDSTDREMALSAFHTLCKVIEVQFGSLGQPWFIPDSSGLAFVRKEYENQPFVREVILPNCQLVGYLHDVKYVPASGSWIALDDFPYADAEISDEEYLKRFTEK